jgi:predicted DNA-binding protein (UPF0251 family)/predicted Fe-Mo cluster-binding NifX family protein
MPKTPKHQLTCKPCATTFAPLDVVSKETVSLLHEEIEALYLADFKGGYLEECALNMGVSRPTFTKLLKSGRKKCVQMLLFNKALHVMLRPMTFVCAVPTDDGECLSKHFNVVRYFAMVEVEDATIRSLTLVDNPLHVMLSEQGNVPKKDEDAAGIGAGRILPPLFKTATHIICSNIGDGMRRNLEGLGLSIKSVSSTETKQPIVKMVKKYLLNS